jgi:hypothetical protein
MMDEFIHARREPRRVAFRNEGVVAEPGIFPRQTGDARELAWNRQAGAAQKAARDLAQRGIPLDALLQRVGKASDGKRPDVRELRLVENGAGDDEHRGLQFVERRD